MRRPASLAPLAFAAALVTGAVVGVVAWLSGGRAFMPGGLRTADPDGDSEVHGGVRAHAELDDCGACHPGPLAGKTASDLCLACHDDIQAELRVATSRHGRFRAQGACLRCHTEHRGADGDLTNVDRDGFDHDTTGFSLAAHGKTKQGAAFRCDDCHGGDTDHFDPKRCEQCHRADDAAFVARHEAAWGAACRACHDGVDRFSRGKFDHAKTTFALAGKHVPVACEQCHPGVRALAAYKRSSACDDCHARDDVHEQRLGTDCGRCHTVDGWKPTIAGAFDHARTRFPLTGAHVQVACDKCHWDGRLAGTPRACEKCHERPRDHFAGACDACHSTTSWRGARRPARGGDDDGGGDTGSGSGSGSSDTTTGASSRRHR